MGNKFNAVNASSIVLFQLHRAGQLRAMCPAEPHLKQIKSFFGVLLVLDAPPPDILVGIRPFV